MQVKINNVWVKMQRANNNQWPYYNTNGPWQTGFPMPIRISSIAGEVRTLPGHPVATVDLFQRKAHCMSLSKVAASTRAPAYLLGH